MSSLTEEQWNSIKHIINGSSGKDKAIDKLSGNLSLFTWILDTCASHHLTGKYDILENVRDMEPVLIIMADGREQVSVKVGSVKLGSGLIMKSVYYVE